MDDLNRVHQLEMQGSVYSSLQRRIIYNISTLSHKTLMKGDSYRLVKEVIALWILAENLDEIPGALDLIEYKSVRHKQNFNLNKIIIMELQKNIKKEGSKYDRLQNWMYILRGWEEYSPFNPPDWIKEDPVFSEVMKAMKIFGMSEEEYDLYLARVEYQLDKALREQDSYDNGLLEGKKEGLAEGAAKGKTEGLVQGEIHALSNMLVTQLQLKYSYPVEDPANIKSITDKEKLNNALKMIVSAETLDEVLECLK